MKVEQKKDFIPVVITLETKEDALKMWREIEANAPKGGILHKLYNLLTPLL